MLPRRWREGTSGGLPIRYRHTGPATDRFFQISIGTAALRRPSRGNCFGRGGVFRAAFPVIEAELSVPAVLLPPGITPAAASAAVSPDEEASVSPIPAASAENSEAGRELAKDPAASSSAEAPVVPKSISKVAPSSEELSVSVLPQPAGTAAVKAAKVTTKKALKRALGKRRSFS